MPRTRQGRFPTPAILPLLRRSLSRGPSRHRVLVLGDERERMQVIDGSPKRGHCSGKDIDHLDESRTRRVEGLEVQPIVEVVHWVEIAKRCVCGRRQGLS